MLLNLLWCLYYSFQKTIVTITFILWTTFLQRCCSVAREALYEPFLSAPWISRVWVDNVFFILSVLQPNMWSIFRRKSLSLSCWELFAAANREETEVRAEMKADGRKLLLFFFFFTWSINSARYDVNTMISSQKSLWNNHLLLISLNYIFSTLGHIVCQTCGSK